MAVRPTEEEAVAWPAKKPPVIRTRPSSVQSREPPRESSRPAAVTPIATYSAPRRPSRPASRPAAAEVAVPTR